jgi:hypothetical protein
VRESTKGWVTYRRFLQHKAKSRTTTFATERIRHLYEGDLRKESLNSMDYGNHTNTMLAFLRCESTAACTRAILVMLTVKPPYVQLQRTIAMPVYNPAVNRRALLLGGGGVEGAARGSGREKQHDGCSCSFEGAAAQSRVPPPHYLYRQYSTATVLVQAALVQY